MGLWNFMKSAGKAIGIGGDDSEDQAEKIKAEIQELGLDAGSVEIGVDGDTVTMRGDAPTQELREKIILAAGNVDGIAAVQEEIATPDAREPVFHTVQTGDTLWAISAKHLGNGARYEEIFAANRPMLTHPDKIYPGQMLRIPA